MVEQKDYKKESVSAVSDGLKQRLPTVQGIIYNNLHCLHFNLQS